jgi:hypothetical protein
MQRIRINSIGFLSLSVLSLLGIAYSWNPTPLRLVKLKYAQHAFGRTAATFSVLLGLSLAGCPLQVSARPEGVNRPDLLPPIQTTVIDTANFLTKGQEKKVVTAISDLEKKTGYKLRLLCQRYSSLLWIYHARYMSKLWTYCFVHSYPNTPGIGKKSFLDSSRCMGGLISTYVSS